MNDRLGGHERTVSLTCLLLSQLLLPTAGPRDFAGNAAYLSVLVTLAVGLAAVVLLRRISGGEAYFDVCLSCGPASGLFLGLLGLLFFLNTVSAFRALLDTLEAYILSLTPRSLVAALLLLCLLPGAFFGSAPIARMQSFYAPVALLLYLLVLALALPHSAHLSNLFPLLGEGAGPVALQGLRLSPALLWLFVLLIEQKSAPRPLRSGLLAVLCACLLLCAGLFVFSLVHAPGSPTETDYPLLQLASLSGYWRYFQRTQSVFVFAWTPLMLAATAAGLCYSGRCLGRAFRMDDPRPVLLPLGILLAAAAAPEIARAPALLRFLVEERLYRLCLLPPLLLPYLVLYLRKRRERGKEHG